MRSLVERSSWCALAALVAGCAGAGGAGAPPLQQPESARAVSGPWPTGGASLGYAGTLAQSGTGGSRAYSIVQQIRVAGGTYDGHPVAVYDGTETQTGQGSTVKTTFVADVGQRKSAIRKGVDVSLFRVKSNDSTGVSTVTTYGAGNGTFDQLPEVPQARWSDTATRTASIDDSVAGSTLVDRYRADGSYDETAVPVAGLSASLESYPDGNAVYQWPFAGGDVNSSVTYSPPAEGKLDIILANGAQHITESVQLGVWYPSVPPVLASDAFFDAGTVRLPKACGVPNRYGTSATEIEETSVRLDVVFGQYETAQRAAYVKVPYGLLCLSLHDQLNAYYDYNALAFSASPLSKTTTDETVGLRTASLHGKTDLAGAAAALPLDVRMTAWQSAQRLRTVRAIVGALRHLKGRR
jgi:hypothetical protein